MYKKYRLPTLVCSIFLVFLLSIHVEAAEPGTAGTFFFVHGNVKIVKNNGKVKVAQKGDSISEGDIIITAKNGSAQILMVDGAYFSVKPNTVMRIDEYFYKKEDETGSSIISLLKGCFRSITGMIGQKNKESYKVKTPVANIGIRGTDHEPMYIPKPGPGEAFIGQPGVYDKVNTGMTYIENAAGVVEVGPNQVGYASDENSQPVLLTEMPDFYTDEPSDGAEGDEDTENDEEEMESILGEIRLAANDDETESSDSLNDIYDDIIEDIFDSEVTLANIEQLKFSVDVEIDDELFTLFPEPGFSALGEELYTGLISWSQIGGLSQYIGYEGEVMFDASGNVIGWTFYDRETYDPNWVKSVLLVNPVISSSETAGHYSETGIEYGTFQVDYIREILFDGTINDYASNGFIHWINAPLESPYYLAQIISGTVSYTFDGGTNPTNQNGIIGTLNSASLTVDFTYQNVDASISLTMNNRDWTATATDMQLDGNRFYGSSASPSFTITHDNSGEVGSMPWGYFSGSLTGEGLNGAVLAYTLGDSYVDETINGVVSFYGPEQDTNASYRTIGLATSYPRTGLTPTVAEQSFSSTSNITTDSSGNITGFDTSIQQSVTSDIENPVHLYAGTSVIENAGYDAETGMIWGRWANDGSISSTDRVTGDPTTATFDPNYVHYIAGPEMTTPVTLPITGEYTYTRIGNTNPTDNLGNIGTLNSATLSANFTDMTVDTALNVSVGNTTFDASASNIAINADATFSATSNDSLSVACTGTGAGTTHSGVVSGAFHGDGGKGVGLAYSFNTTNGSTIDTTVAGVAAFKR